jgi:hypothetical protein
MGIGVADGSGRAHGPREGEEGKGGTEEPNKAYVGGPYVWTEGYLRWTRRAEAWRRMGRSMMRYHRACSLGMAHRTVSEK